MDFPTCPYETRKAKIQSGTYHTPLKTPQPVILKVEVDDEEDDMENED